MPSVEDRLRYWRTRARRMQVALEDIATDEVQSHSDDELGLLQRMQDTARGVLGDDPSEFDKLRATIASLTAEQDNLKNALGSLTFTLDHGQKLVASLTEQLAEAREAAYRRGFSDCIQMDGNDRDEGWRLYSLSLATLSRLEKQEGEK